MKWSIWLTLISCADESGRYDYPYCFVRCEWRWVSSRDTGIAGDEMKTFNELIVAAALTMIAGFAALPFAAQDQPQQQPSPREQGELEQMGPPPRQSYQTENPEQLQQLVAPIACTRIPSSPPCWPRRAIHRRLLKPTTGLRRAKRSRRSKLRAMLISNPGKLVSSPYWRFLLQFETWLQIFPGRLNSAMLTTISQQTS